jgi:hypothetical protein
MRVGYWLRIRITTAILHDLVQLGGMATGVDFSDKRIKHAVDNYENGNRICLLRYYKTT